MQAQKNEFIKFEFIIGSRPDQLKADSSRKLRSYLSKRSWQAHRLQCQLSQRDIVGLPSAAISSSDSWSDTQSSTKSQDRIKTSQNRTEAPANTKYARRRRNKLQAVTFELVQQIPVEPAQDFTWQLGQNDRCSTTEQQHYTQQNRMLVLFEQRTTSGLSMDAYFGGIRVDPFRSYPGTWQPHIPALADHYIVQMARDIPELDQPGNKGLLRSRWFPLVISDAAPFQVVMLLSAANYASVNSVNGLGCHILGMKHEAIAAINDAFRGNKDSTGDALIGAVAKMASFEAMHGDVDSYKMHMEGLERMLAARGGLDNLGLGGLLRRMIVWIDLNSSFLLNIPRYFPGTTFTGVEERGIVEELEPNPERFIAV